MSAQELKAQAYDILVKIEQLQIQLRQISQALVEEGMKKELPKE